MQTQLVLSDGQLSRGLVELPAQASTDAQLIDLWLHGRGENTQRAYRRAAEELLLSVDCGLRSIALGMLQGWVDGEHMQSLAPASRGRSIAAVKSLFSFGLRLGYLPLNVAAVVRIPRVKDRLAERIIDEAAVHAMLHDADRAFKAAKGREAARLAARDLVLLRLMYASGARVSEICGLSWADCVPRSGGQGQVTLFGKGDKTRTVLLSAATWTALEALRAVGGPPSAPVFSSRKGGGHLSTVQVWRIVRAAARRAGLTAPVSPHFMRHAHASHAIDRGAPLHTVQATLGHASVATTGRYLHVRPEESSALVLGV